MTATLTGMKVCTIAPSSHYAPEAYEAGVRILHDLGCTLVRETHLRDGGRFRLNGTDAERLQELQAALCDTECDIVWFARGGYGLSRIINRLQLPSHRRYPIVVGFSDATVLLAHLWKQLKVPSIYGPVLTQLKDEPPSVIKSLVLLLTGKGQSIEYPLLTPLSDTCPPLIQGSLLPANLCMLNHLIGTPSMPQLTNCILMLEDIAEQPYQLDRRLTHLFEAGLLTGVAGIVVGHLTKCSDDALAVFIERCKSFGLPLWGHFPFGHTSPNWPLPFGCRAEIRSQGEHSTLHIIEEVRT